MNFFFLSAEKPIAKHYELSPQNSVIKHPYPFIYDVTSYKVSALTLRDLYSRIKYHADKKHCLLKGQLNRILVHESRKGSTDPEELTQWICLDLDGVCDYESIDLFLEDIGCGGVDYILQWSSSMYIENKAGFRCHIFLLLNRPTKPQILKNWLIGLNLIIPNLNKQLELTKTGNSLRWTLDITTCQNDKLLYIAPPILDAGIKDPFIEKERIIFIEKENRELVLPRILTLPDTLRDMTNTKIAELRAKHGFTKAKAPKYKFEGTVEYMANPGTAVISEIKKERGFVYFNLNNGDSWGYYHSEEHPNFIHNFKGEPVYRTQDLLPQYWAQLTTSAASGAPDSQGYIYLAFREFTSATYWNGIYDTKKDVLELHVAKSETQLRHFMMNHNMPLGESVPDWTRVFEPNNSNVIDHDKQTVNIYNPSIYFKNPLKTNKKVACPPICYKIIHHVLGNDDAATEHFMNWLACIAQYKTRTGTAWVFHGTEGTGKGLLFHNILTPLFGAENVTAKRMEEIESQFTGYMENKFIAFIDEIETGQSLYHNKITAKLKNLIVEPMISIRNMYRNPYMAPNFCSMIFASNKPASVQIAPDDRRFNVGGYQTKKIEITTSDIENIEQELPEFHAYLMQYKADRNLARSPLVSQSRSTLIDISRTAIDTIADALLSGDIQLLWDNLPSTREHTIGNSLLQMKAQGYRELVISIVENMEIKLSRDDLYTIMEYLVGNMPLSPNKFTSLLKHHRLHMQAVWKNNRTVRGISVPWHAEAEWLATARREIMEGVV